MEKHCLPWGHVRENSGNSWSSIKVIRLLNASEKSVKNVYKKLYAKVGALIKSTIVEIIHSTIVDLIKPVQPSAGPETGIE